MRNYEYIIASLPELDRDGRTAKAPDATGIVEFIAGQLDGQDRKLFGLVADGFSDSLDRGFYTEALNSGNPFIRDYFQFDLNVRNAKVEYLNRELGRPAGTDVLTIDEGCEWEHDFDGSEEVAAVLASDDILERERGIDDLMWRKCDELTVFSVFGLDMILAFEVRLKIVERWLKLDPESGRELFRRLVNEIKNSNKI